ncbi:hypothetical protein FIBSPDRAFT_482736 [Athelia psychrophila]|uniref:Uncharacterized protein n=1 Tax=Athelia psychrophila TaxID=1759441 RepID=A0A166L094_9AGAM|nr:hypothetical protein FIBSPDRAFT_482736 [Fibularhizoctonia sp. CBS 109695]
MGATFSSASYDVFDAVWGCGGMGECRCGEIDHHRGRASGNVTVVHRRFVRRAGDLRRRYSSVFPGRSRMFKVLISVSLSIEPAPGTSKPIRIAHHKAKPNDKDGPHEGTSARRSFGSRDGPVGFRRMREWCG